MPGRATDHAVTLRLLTVDVYVQSLGFAVVKVALGKVSSVLACHSAF